MEEIYIVISMVILLFIYIYNNNLNSCLEENNKTFKYFDDVYINIPQKNNMRQQPIMQNYPLMKIQPIEQKQESMNTIDETLKHFKSGGKEMFNAQLSRHSDSSIIERYTNGSPIYDNYDSGSLPKNRRELDIHPNNDVKWSSHIENFADDMGIIRDDDIDSKYTESILQKGDSHFYALKK